MEIRIAVLCDETPDGKSCVAAVEEHYDYATVDPSRIFVQHDGGKALEEDGWKALKEDGRDADFVSICDLFMQESRFYAWPQSAAGVFATLNVPGAPGKPGEPDVSSVPGGSKVPSSGKRSSGELAKALADYQKVIDRVTETYGEFLPFFQILLIQDLYPMLVTKKTCNEMGIDEDSLVTVLKQLDDDMISGCGCIPEDVLIKILSLKHGTDLREKFVYRSGKLKFDNLLVVPLKEIPFRVEHIACENGMCRVRGTVMLPLEHDGIDYYYADNRNREYEIEWEDGEELFFLGERMRTRKRFCAQLKIGNKPAGLRFMYRYKGACHDKNTYRARIRMIFSDDIGMEEETRHNFTVLQKYVLKIEKRILFITPLRFKTRIKLFFTFPGKSIKMILCGK